mgnify:CR=1 FL=1
MRVLSPLSRPVSTTLLFAAAILAGSLLGALAPTAGSSVGSFADPLIIRWQCLGQNGDGDVIMFLSPEDIYKDEEDEDEHGYAAQGNFAGLRPYMISLAAPGPTGTAANPAGTNNMLDPLIHFDQEGFPGYPSEFEESAFGRGEDPMWPDIEDVVTRALLRETPDIDAAALPGGGREEVKEVSSQPRPTRATSMYSEKEKRDPTIMKLLNPITPHFSSPGSTRMTMNNPRRRFPSSSITWRKK